MRTIRRWLPLLLVGLPLLGAAAFGGGIVVTDHLEENNTFCTACHLHEKKFTEFHPVQGKRVTLAAAHNLESEKKVKCIDLRPRNAYVSQVSSHWRPEPRAGRRLSQRLTSHQDAHCLL